MTDSSVTRRCWDDACGGVIPENARADARFCSVACKQRTYRLRKRLFAPYGGSADAALAAAIRYFDTIRQDT